jgi:hypothetical protein
MFLAGIYLDALPLFLNLAPCGLCVYMLDFPFLYKRKRKVKTV